MDVNILIKNLSTIDESPALAILDPFSQDNLESFFIGIGEICVAFHANSVSLASSSMMAVPAVDLPYSAPESDFSTIGAVLRCSIRRGFNIVRDVLSDLRSASSQKNLFLWWSAKALLPTIFLKITNSYRLFLKRFVFLARFFFRKHILLPRAEKLMYRSSIWVVLPEFSNGEP